MKPRSPQILVAAVVVLAVLCAAWLASLSTRPASGAERQAAGQAKAKR
jgi:hypothetical protein